MRQLSNDLRQCMSIRISNSDTHRLEERRCEFLSRAAEARVTKFAAFLRHRQLADTRRHGTVPKSIMSTRVLGEVIMRRCAHDATCLAR